MSQFPICSERSELFSLNENIRRTVIEDGARYVMPLSHHEAEKLARVYAQGLGVSVDPLPECVIARWVIEAIRAASAGCVA